MPFGAAGVEKIAFINTNKMLPELDECQFRIACDVDNPLYGEKGCSHIFGPQKGATPEVVEEMDGWIKRFAGLTAEYFAQSGNRDEQTNYKTQAKNVNITSNSQDIKPSEPAFSNPDYPGCGAAGGLGFAFRAFLHGQLEPRTSIVLEEIKIKKQSPKRTSSLPEKAAWMDRLLWEKLLSALQKWRKNTENQSWQLLGVLQRKQMPAILPESMLFSRSCVR